MLSKIPIKWRITILTATLLSIVCGILTMTSIKSADAILFNHSEQSGNDVIIVEGQSKILEDTNLSQIVNNQKEFSSRQIIYMIVIICVGSALSYYLAGKALKPITILSKEISGIDEYRLNIKISVPDSNDEVSSLAGSFNQLLAKLDSAFDNQRLFTQNVAHELKTPLASVMASIDVLEMDKNPSNQDLFEVVQIAKKNMDRLSAIVNDVMSINSEMDKNAFHSFDFMIMIGEIEVEYLPLIAEKKITLHKKGNIDLYGNRALLYRAFSNILLNAIRYNKEYGTIEIICEGNKIIIADTGMGIPVDSLEHIFEPFYCVDRSRSRALGGSGLGLPMVKSILDKHNMHIKVESVMDIGTKIIITIP